LDTVLLIEECELLSHDGSPGGNRHLRMDRQTPLV